MSSHELHVLQIIHIGGIGVDVIGAGIGSGLYCTGNVSIVHMGKARGDLDVFHSGIPPN